MSRINALNINAIFNGNFIIFKDSILIQQNLLEPQSLNCHTINSHQPLITEKKDCIYCGESIDMEAKICPYCGIFQEDD